MEGKEEEGLSLRVEAEGTLRPHHRPVRTPSSAMLPSLPVSQSSSQSSAATRKCEVK